MGDVLVTSFGDASTSASANTIFSKPSIGMAQSRSEPNSAKNIASSAAS
jgi:hypothetical protein